MKKTASVSKQWNVPQLNISAVVLSKKKSIQKRKNPLKKPGNKLYGKIIGGARNVKVKNSLQQIVIVLHVFQLMVPTIDGFR